MADRERHQADHVFALGLDAAEDAHIWDWALREAAIVVTKDGDFARRRHARVDGPVVIWLRVGNATNPELLRWLDARWSQIIAEVEAGRAVVEAR
jgi:predicted nuclease of predicted toxin-antitoxin system